MKLVHDFIVELRNRTISYAAIAELLQRHGVKTSRARVAEYVRIVLEDGKKRKRRRRTKAVLTVNLPTTPQNVPAVTANSTLATPPATAVTSEITPSKENSAFTSRGPRIAKVAMMTPEEAKAFNDSLKPKPPAS